MAHKMQNFFHSKYRFLLLIFLLLFLAPITGAAPEKSFTTNDDLLLLNGRYYEIAFNKTDGGVAYILDKTTGEEIATGTKDSVLWAVSLTGGRQILSTDSNFSYSWNQARQELTLIYKGNNTDNIDVMVTVSGLHDCSLKMQAIIENYNDFAVESVSLPYTLEVVNEKVIDALLPMIPGVRLQTGFFAGQKSFTGLYPGVMFADYLSLRSENGKIALYGRADGVLQPVNLGFAHEGIRAAATGIIHNYRTWIEQDETWTSPYVIIHVGQDYPGTIAAYREINGIAQFRSLAEKLGEKKQQFFESPLYKLDIPVLGQTFAELKDTVIDHIKVPGLLHPVAFQPIGFDNHYPDFLPPASRFGTTEDLAVLVAYAQQKGNLVIPYTNFSWWNVNSPTLQNLPSTLESGDIAVNRRDGSSMMEIYASEGYVMNLHHEFVINRITGEQEKLLKKAGFDGIFEDQLGARNAPYDFNPAGLEKFDPSTSYFAGVLAHARRLAENTLLTECGIDMLAAEEVCFLGANYLWDLLGYRPETAPYSEYYPMIGMLCRDKVLLYQHNLAAETWTNDKEIFRWNLAQGYNLSTALTDLEHPWLPVIGVFQKHVLSRYAGELVTAFTYVEDRVTCTSFENYEVYVNWDERNSYSHLGHVIAPGGVLVVATDGSVTAGIFTNYNNSILSGEEHFLIETRSDDAVKIFHPQGRYTLLHIKKPPEWPGVNVHAYGYNDRPVTEVKAGALADDLIRLEGRSTLEGTEVAYYKITRSDEPNEQAYPMPAIPDLIVTGITISPEHPCTGDKVTFQATIKNIGTGPTPEEIHDVEFSIDGSGVLWSEHHTTPVPAGASVTVASTRDETGPFWEAAEGIHIVTAWVDRNNNIQEINPGNNTFDKGLPPIEEGIEIAPGVRAPKPPDNLALNKPIVSTGATSQLYGERLANDGLINTYWESVNNEFPAHLTVDFTAEMNINEVVLKLSPSTAWERRVQTITLLGAVDKDDFFTIIDETDYTFDPATENIVNITFPETKTRYLRLVFDGNTAWPAGQVAEIEVYGDN